MGFLHGSVGKESACKTGDLSSIPGLGRSPGEVKGYPIHYSGLENSLFFFLMMRTFNIYSLGDSQI